MGKTYTVDMDAKTLLAPQVALTEKQKTFTTPEFYYRGGRAEFYQDPQDPMKKHAIIGLTFNAPADVKNLESRLSMTRDGKPDAVYRHCNELLSFMLTPVPGGIDVPTQQLGEQSCNLLFSLIAGEKGLQNITVGTQISLADSLV